MAALPGRGRVGSLPGPCIQRIHGIPTAAAARDPGAGFSFPRLAEGNTSLLQAGPNPTAIGSQDYSAGKTSSAAAAGQG